jgi:ribonuclease HI
MRRPRPRIASPTSHTAATVEPASRKRCTEATTLGVEDATAVRRIGAPRPNRQVRESPASNNVAEYEALVNGLRIVVELGVRRLDARGDLQLVIDQVMKNSHYRD